MYCEPTRPIVIKPANRERLQAALTAAEGRATVRLVSAEDLIKLTTELEELLRRSSRKQPTPAPAAHTPPPAHRFPRTYKWRPEGTA